MGKENVAARDPINSQPSALYVNLSAFFLRARRHFFAFWGRKGLGPSLGPSVRLMGLHVASLCDSVAQVLAGASMCLEPHVIGLGFRVQGCGSGVNQLRS